MKHPLEIIPHHEQLHLNSCVAWGLELILKMHEKIGQGEYPLQNGVNPTGWGFGETTKEMLKSYGISSKEDSLEIEEFKEMALLEARRDFYPIFSVLDHLNVDYANNTVGVIYHIWAVTNGIPLVCHSRGYNNPNPLFGLPVEPLFYAVRNNLIPDYRIHCLLHESA